jgi:hypothetical protein
MASSSANQFEGVRDRVVEQLKGSVNRDKATVRDMMKWKNEIVSVNNNRGKLMKDLFEMEDTKVKGVGLLFLKHAEDRDVEVLERLLELFENMEESIRVRVKYVNSVI